MSFARYSRQMLFPKFGKSGQERVRQASVGLVGLGALGSTIAETLVRAGIGRLVAVDRDVLEITNLHRQGLYAQEDADLGLPKAVAAKARLAAMNPEVDLDCRVGDLGPENAREIFLGVDLILDGTDSFETRYLLNDLAIAMNVPWIYGACVAAGGMTATIIPGKTPCLACLFPEAPAPGSHETCDTAGIIAPAAQIVAALQVTEAFKILVGDLDAVRHTLLSFELWPFRLVELGKAGSRPRPDCTACGERRFDWLDGRGPTRTVKLCGRNSVQVFPSRAAGGFALAELARRLTAVGPVADNGFALTFAADGLSLTVFEDGRALIKGTTDPVVARSTYARWVGL